VKIVRREFSHLAASVAAFPATFADRKGTSLSVAAGAYPTSRSHDPSINQCR